MPEALEGRPHGVILAPISPPLSASTDQVARRLFKVLAIASLILMATVSGRYAISTDEPLQSRYGKHAYAYFRSGFRDRTVLHFDQVSATPQHGVLFDLFCTGAERVSPLTRFGTRHLLNSIVGWVGIVYTARIAGVLRGPMASCLAILFLLLSPRYFGDSMNNPKDVPFAAAYAAATYYLLCAGPNFPFFTPSLLLKSVIAIGAAIETRAGGLILLGYLWILLLARSWSARLCGARQWLAIALLGGAACVLAILAGVAFWPWAQQKPFLRPFQALSILSDYSWAGNFRVLFNGTVYRADGLPRSYIPVWLLITTPVVVLVCAGISIPLMAQQGRETARAAAFVWLTFLCPVVSVAWSQPTLYNGMRHLLFVYPALVALAGFSAAAMIDAVSKRRSLKWSFIGVLAVGLWDPLRFSIVNHPLQITYFNPLIGGVRGAFVKYDIDYWANSFGQAIEWIQKSGNFPLDRPVRVSGIKHPTADVVPSYAEESSRIRYDGVYKAWDADVYLDMVSADRPPPRNSWNSGRVLHAVKVDGVPIALVRAGPAWKAP